MCLTRFNQLWPDSLHEDTKSDITDQFFGLPFVTSDHQIAIILLFTHILMFLVDNVRN